MNQKIVICNMSGIYDQQDFYRNTPHSFQDLRSIRGINGYCEDTAAEELKKSLKNNINNTLYFIDNGNFHYISKLRCDLLEEDFDLVVLDHHSDMEEPAFGTILSCGSWILFTLRENVHLRRILLIGPDAEQLRILEPLLEREVSAGERLTVLSEEDIKSGAYKAKLDRWIREKAPDSRLFISVDKDVLGKDVVDTNWDQGSMSLEQMEEILKEFSGLPVIGADVCGEAASGDPSLNAETVEKSSRVNERLIAIFSGLL
ncbi:MAG: arginase family protein [Lachnospiraceae bacterium]|nr:arginase family protein [Lachnospiraceae bacterium]